MYITSVSVKQPIPPILLSNPARAGLAAFGDRVVGTLGDYLSDSGVKGVGSDSFGNAVNIREGTERIAPATLISGASKLGSAYIEDSQSYYGADGFPVLRWQKKLGKVKNTRLTCVSDTLQRKFDRFIDQNPASERPEWPVIIFFNHSAFTSQAIGDFHEQ